MVITQFVDSSVGERGETYSEEEFNIMSNDLEESAVEDFIKILEEHRRNCEKNGKYVEAEIAKNRLEELRMHEEHRRREAMKSRQIAERLGVEEAHMLEFQQFNTNWDKKMEDYESHAKELVATMQQRHQEELTDWQKRTMTTSQQKVKFSQELLNLRVVQDRLAKNKDYQQAAIIKARADNREALELQKLGNKTQQLLYSKEQRFKEKQKVELNGLLKRIQTGRNEQKKQRQSELEHLLQRYKNVKMELEAQQNLERVKLDKYAGASPKLLNNSSKKVKIPRKLK